MLSVLAIAVVAFVSTNIDDVFLLVAFFSHKAYKPTQVVMGQYLGMGVLVLVSALGAYLSLSIVPAYVGLLGILPIIIGLKSLLSKEEETTKVAPTGNVMSVAAVVIANGGDNIGIYIPLFATLNPAQFTLTLIVFALMTGLLCLAGHWLVYHKRLGHQVQHWGQRLLPFVLIALGLYILWHEGSLSLLGV